MKKPRWTSGWMSQFGDLGTYPNFSLHPSRPRVRGWTPACSSWDVCVSCLVRERERDSFVNREKICKRRFLLGTVYPTVLSSKTSTVLSTVNTFFYPRHPLHHHPNPSQLHLSISHLQCHHGVCVRFHSRINENHPRIIDTSQFFSNRRACINRKQMNSQKHASPRGVPGRSGRRDQNGDSRNRLTYAFPSLRKGFKPHILHQCDSGGHQYLIWTFQNLWTRVRASCGRM